MGKQLVTNLPREPLHRTWPGCTIARALSGRRPPELGHPSAISACSAVSVAPPQGPTLQTLNGPRLYQPLTPKAFQNIADGQPRRAGAPPSVTDRSIRLKPERVQQWSPSCAIRRGLDVRLAHLTSRSLLPHSPLNIPHSLPLPAATLRMNSAKGTQKHALAPLKTPVSRQKRTQKDPPLIRKKRP